LTGMNGSSWEKTGWVIVDGVILVTFKYTGLSGSNSEFNKDKKVAATLTLGGGSSEDEQAIEIFFAKDETNHPNGNDPNWFYYWDQTGASVGNPEYDPNYSEWGYFSTSTGKIYIGQKGGSTWGSLDGIDTFASTCRHELRHKTDYDYSRGKTDSDGDWMIDSEEATLKDHDGNWYGKRYGKDYPFDPTKYWTYFRVGSIYNDKEVRALDEAYNWTEHRKGDYDSVDWSKNGHQWSK